MARLGLALSVKITLKKSGSGSDLMHGHFSLQSGNSDPSSREISSLANDIGKKVLRTITKDDPSLDASKRARISANVSYSLFETSSGSSTTGMASAGSHDGS